ncbi:hypothetical protein BU16DRAFT_365873 [Lophium mytilinum]|uniref:Secreted protein n=1 Tax=Lophium mytilinum TaxID=390894 RepID=A0A6A6QWL0_9PEZI|nr:hypothetical protein BU16DRAFT_365873 [Lophium mytilinum]
MGAYRVAIAFLSCFSFSLSSYRSYLPSSRQNECFRNLGAVEYAMVTTRETYEAQCDQVSNFNHRAHQPQELIIVAVSYAAQISGPHWK